MIIELTPFEAHKVSGGTFLEITREMPDFYPRPFEKFYTIIIKTLCDYQNGDIDLSVI